MIEISINRGANISIHQQLATQFSLQIASGILKPGTRLPSIRALSMRLKIHYNTCLSIYKELAEYGLVEITKGSGVKVAKFTNQELDANFEAKELGQLAKYFIKTIEQKGYSWEEVLMALNFERQRLETNSAQIVFADVHADILPLFKAELESHLNVEVETKLISELSQNPSTKYLVSRYHCKALKQRLNTEDNIEIIEVNTAQDELNIIKNLAKGSFISLVSHSSIILQIGEALINGLRGEDVIVKPVLYSEGKDRVQRIVQNSDLVVSDFLCSQELKGLTNRPFYTVRVVSDTEIKRLKTSLKLP
jgi:DNA-binding transcriptional regulator YhcF (GntR family)